MSFRREPPGWSGLGEREHRGTTNDKRVGCPSMATPGRVWCGATTDARGASGGPPPPTMRPTTTASGASPSTDDVRLFEKICLEGFQSGLSWLTILRKREAFRRAFRGFDFAKVARFTSRDVRRLLGDASIVRHRGKILSTIQNAAESPRGRGRVRIAPGLLLAVRARPRAHGPSASPWPPCAR